MGIHGDLTRRVVRLGANDQDRPVEREHGRDGGGLAQEARVRRGKMGAVHEIRADVTTLAAHITAATAPTPATARGRTRDRAPLIAASTAAAARSRKPAYGMDV